jgi:hypothetical protein
MMPRPNERIEDAVSYASSAPFAWLTVTCSPSSATRRRSVHASLIVAT